MQSPTPRREKVIQNVTQKKLTERQSKNPKPRPFHLLLLPAEIRNMIYRLLLLPCERDVSKVHLLQSRGKGDGTTNVECNIRQRLRFAYMGRPFDVSLRYKPAIMLLNRQVGAEFHAVYFTFAEFLVNVWDGHSQDQTWKDMEELPLQYLASCTIFLNAGWNSSSYHRNAQTPVTLGDIQLRWSASQNNLNLRRLIAVLKAMPRVDSLKIFYNDWRMGLVDSEIWHPQLILAPFAKLTGLRNVTIQGELSDEYAANLRSRMMRIKTAMGKRTRRQSDTPIWLRRRLRHPTLEADRGSFPQVLSTSRPTHGPKAPTICRLCEL